MVDKDSGMGKKKRRVFGKKEGVKLVHMEGVVFEHKSPIDKYVHSVVHYT